MLVLGQSNSKLRDMKLLLLSWLTWSVNRFCEASRQMPGQDIVPEHLTSPNVTNQIILALYQDVDEKCSHHPIHMCVGPAAVCLEFSY